jgi:hypothetical protein
MTYNDLISHYGTQSAAGAALTPLRGKPVAQPTVAGWKKDGIPEAVQAQYEIVTRGKLKAERPKINGHKREARVS